MLEYLLFRSESGRGGTVCMYQGKLLYFPSQVRLFEVKFLSQVFCSMMDEHFDVFAIIVSCYLHMDCIGKRPFNVAQLATNKQHSGFAKV